MDKANPMLIWSVILFWFALVTTNDHCVAQLLFVSRCLALAIQAASFTRLIRVVVVLYIMYLMMQQYLIPRWSSSTGLAVL